MTTPPTGDPEYPEVTVAIAALRVTCNLAREAGIEKAVIASGLLLAAWSVVQTEKDPELRLMLLERITRRWEMMQVGESDM